MKKLIAAAAAVAMALSAYCDGVAYWTDTAGVKWRVSYLNASHEAHIVDAEGYTDTLDVPGTVEVGETQYTVNDIRQSAFLNATAVKTVILPDSLHTVESSAFKGCTALATLRLGGDLEYIGADAFAGCTALRFLTLPRYVDQIADGAFAGCTALSQVRFAGEMSSVEFYPEMAFANTPYLAGMNVNDNWKDAIALTGPAGSVAACNALATTEGYDPADMPANTMWWKWTAPAGVSRAAFHTCGSDFDTVLGVYTVTALNALTEVAYSDDFLNDDENYGSKSLASFEATPGQTYYICVAGYSDASFGAIALSWNTIAAGGFECIVHDGVLVGFLGECPSALTIPGTAVRIADGVFEYDEEDNPSVANITSLVTPESLDRIGEDAFSGCANLAQVALGEGLRVVGAGAFDCCTALAGGTVELPSTVRDVDGDAFANIGGALTVYAPNSVSDDLKSGTYGTTELTVFRRAVPISGCTSVTLYPEGGEFGIAVPVPEDGECRTTIQLRKDKTEWGNAVSRKPRMDGYVFDGFWTKRQSGGVQVWDADMKCASGASYWSADGAWASSVRSLSLYARWKQILPPARIWTLKYHSNNGKNDLDTQNFKVGEEKRLYYMNSRLGWEYKDEGGFNYVFLGWAKSPTGAVFYGNGELVKDLVDEGKVMHVYAVWQKRAYSVCFHSNDGRNLSKTQEFRPNIAKNLLWLDSGLGWTREGYDFVGWSKAPTSTAVVYANGQNVNNLVAQGQTLHLYAVWRDRRWTIIYHRNYSAGDTPSVEQKIPVGASVNLKWLDSQLGWTRSGYVFKGWAKSRTGGAVYQNGQTVKDLVPGGQVLHIYGAWGQKAK